MLIRCTSHPRAGLIGNPSDGYNGKTIAFLIRNFSAEVVLWESPELEILPAKRDLMIFDTIDHLVDDVHDHGYYGGFRLLKASVKRFHDYCRGAGHKLHNRNFSLRYSSDIPPHVGMAGSSAIITACFKALMTFYDVTIPPAELANIVLSVENDELKIPAGLQDRVIQAYEGLVFMDFAKEHFDKQGTGHYESIPPDTLPLIYVAYTTIQSEGTEVFHNDIRGRYHRGDRAVLDAMEEWADLAQQTRDMLIAGRGAEIGSLLNRNFDLRRSLYEISPGNIDMVETARAAGASAKFTGSGGAIVGTYPNEPTFDRLKSDLEAKGISVIKPQIEASPQ